MLLITSNASKFVFRRRFNSLFNSKLQALFLIFLSLAILDISSKLENLIPSLQKKVLEV